MYKNAKRSLAVEIDKDNKTMMMYDTENGEVREETVGILNKTNKEIGLEIAEYYGVELSDYGVEILEDDESYPTN